MVTLAYKNTDVIKFDFNKHAITAVTPELIPYSLRRYEFNSNNSDSKEEALRELFAYLSYRMLMPNRMNGKQLCLAFRLSDSSTPANREHICMLCRGVSLTDSYWIKMRDDEKWEDFNLRHKTWPSVLNTALFGIPSGKQYNVMHPDLTTKGSTAKGWLCVNDTQLLLKTDATYNQVRSRMEVLASDVLMCFNVPRVIYKSKTINGRFISYCKRFTDDSLSFVEAWEVLEYMGSSFDKLCRDKFARETANIAVLDYIIANPDRNLQNWGFMMNDLGELVDVAPMFDFNQALLADLRNVDISGERCLMFDRKESIAECKDKLYSHSSIKFSSKLFNTVCNDYPDVKSNIAKRIYFTLSH